ncbi:MAG: hypothetical protein NC223_11565 [Butyrivibrio sp.]|nr:hypothetical protein [Butyrivibrio sp.]
MSFGDFLSDLDSISSLFLSFFVSVWELIKSNWILTLSTAVSLVGFGVSIVKKIIKIKP